MALTILKLVQLGLLVILLGFLFGGAYLAAAHPEYPLLALLSLIGNHFLMKRIRG